MSGQDKGLLNVGGHPMIEYVLRSLRTELDKVVISANRNLDDYSRYGLPVLTDKLPDFAGPLAGLASAMTGTDTDYILTVPCDGPILPQALVSILIERLNGQQAEICTVHDGERLQPAYALVSRKLRSDLIGYLENGERKMDRWYLRHRLAIVDFSEQHDAFINVNSPEDLQTVRTRLKSIKES